MNIKDKHQAKILSNYTIFIVIITMLTWLNIVLFFTMGDSEAKVVIYDISYFLTFILLLDVLVRWRVAKSARKYFIEEHGWLDLIGSFPLLSFARVPNVVKTIKKLRTLGMGRIFRTFVNNRGETAVLSITLAVIFLMEFGSIFILWAESSSSDANIVTSSDAVWWVLVTVATVGYGDKYPVTNNGRFIATFVIVAGIGLFGILSGYMAKVFLGQKEDENRTVATTATADKSAKDTPANLDDVLAEIKQMRQEQAGVSNRLASIEQFLEGEKKKKGK